MRIGALDADEIALPEQMQGIALLDVGHGLGCLDAFGQQLCGIGEGALALGLADACGVDEAVGQARLTEALHVELCAVGGLHADDEIAPSAIDIRPLTLHRSGDLLYERTQVLIAWIDGQPAHDHA